MNKKEFEKFKTIMLVMNNNKDKNKVNDKKIFFKFIENDNNKDKVLQNIYYYENSVLILESSYFFFNNTFLCICDNIDENILWKCRKTNNHYSIIINNDIWEIEHKNKSTQLDLFTIITSQIFEYGCDYNCDYDFEDTESDSDSEYNSEDDDDDNNFELELGESEDEPEYDYINDYKNEIDEDDYITV
jgi:hypothetical protein